MILTSYHKIESAQLFAAICTPTLSAESRAARDNRDAAVGNNAHAIDANERAKRRGCYVNVNSPLSNFLPSGSISFTLKISSNSTPAIVKTNERAALLRQAAEAPLAGAYNERGTPVASPLTPLNTKFFGRAKKQFAIPRG